MEEIRAPLDGGLLVDQLFNSSAKRLARALLLLAYFGEEGKPETVQNENVRVHRAAAMDLGGIASEAVPALIDALRDESEPTRRAAAEALRRIEPDADDESFVHPTELSDFFERRRQLCRSRKNEAPQALERAI